MNQPYALSELPVSEAAVETRADFITKAYTHLAAAIAGFVALEYWFLNSDIARSILEAVQGRWFLLVAGLMVLSWLASRTAHRAKSLPVQYAALAGYVALEALVFAPILYIANMYYDGVLWQAAVTTGVGFAGLTMVAFMTRKDFSFLRGLMYWGGICAILVIVAAAFMGASLGAWFSVAMIAFAGAAILYDTSNVIHHFPANRYVAAALELFGSVMLMFWYVLRLFMNRD